MKKLIYLIAPFIFSGCGTSEVFKNPDSTLRVAAQYGSLNGSWDRAQIEAVTKAKQHCQQMGMQFNFVNEARTGVPGWSPQKSEVTFTCSQDIAEMLNNLANDCNKDYEDSALDPIREKVEFLRQNPEGAIPFQIASNEQYPTSEEKTAISLWAKFREKCIEKNRKIKDIQLHKSTPIQQVFEEKMRGYENQLESRVSELIVALYQSKLTYREFAINRAEIVRNISAMQRDFRSSSLIADRDAQLKAQQLTLQQMQNNLLTWSAYLQSINSRQPYKVNLDANVRLQTNCTTSKIANTISTNCN
jgi:capsule polysaccharide export protein KpsE/RkpR